jgi:hypothetical protein
MGGPNLVNPTREKNQAYHNQPVGGWAWAKLAGGWKGGSILWPREFDKKLTFGGVVSHNQKVTGGPNLSDLPCPPPPTHHSKP